MNPPADRTRITRLREKASDERSRLDELLDSTPVGHFALVDDEGRPVVFPTAIVRNGDRVLVHGSTGSPWMRRLATGVETSLAVTALDGLVVARSAFESSLHYRSAVLFGRCAVLDNDEHAQAVDRITDALLPGRTAELRRPHRSELAATLVLALTIEQWSLKISNGWPDDAAEDVEGEAWAGVVPLTRSWGPPAAAPDLRDGIALPASVLGLDQARGPGAP